MNALRAEHVEGSQSSGDRITVTLISKATEDLRLLHGRTGLSKTGLMNRAIILYEFVDDQLGSGHDILARNPSNGGDQACQAHRCPGRTGSGRQPLTRADNNRAHGLCRLGNRVSMRVVELSNHPGALLREIRLRPDGDDGGAARYEAALARHRDQVRRAEQARDAARAGHRWWAWFRGIFAVRRARRHPPEPPRATGTFADQQEILMAGIEGEQLVASGFGRVLNDEWTLIRGYRNRRGEIDHLLLGPRGLIAIEGKHRNALVHCAGDHWWFIKFDKYGNEVDRGEVTDSRGRSPISRRS